MTSAGRGRIAETLFLTLALVRHRALGIRRDWKSRSLYGFALFLSSAVFLSILTGTFAGVRILQAASASGLLLSIPAWAFLIYLFTDILIAFGQALGDLYLSRDMPVLLTMPLRTSSIVVAKFALGVAQNEVYAVIFLAPFAIGYLYGVKASLWAYPIAIVAVLAFPATLYAALIVVTIVALRFIPPKIAKEGLWFIGASVPTIFWFLSFYKVAHITGSVANMRLPSPPDWLPSTWVGSTVAMLGAGNTEAAGAWFALLLLVTFVACPVAISVVARSFEKGWSAAVAAAPRRQTKFVDRPQQTTPTAALFFKDLKTFFRSPQLWFNHIATIVFLVYLLLGNRYQTPLLPLTLQLAMAQIGFAAVLGALNPGMTALSLEHLAIWFLKSSPLEPGQILGAKFGAAFAQSGTVAALGGILLASGYGFDTAQTAMLVAFGIVASASAVCVGIAFDCAYPSFTWENPNHINRGLRMIVPFLVNLGVLVACSLSLFVARAIAPSEGSALAVGSALSAGLYAICAGTAVRMARRDIEALEV